MKKSYVADATNWDDGDIAVRYMVTKIAEGSVDTVKMTKSIVHYVQNNEIYFGFEPAFHDGVLIFSIVGFPHDHEELQQHFKGNLKKFFNCKLEILPYETGVTE